MILVASQLNRVSLQKYGFLALAALFIALGTMFITRQKEGVVAIVLYVIGQLIFNFGMFSQHALSSRPIGSLPLYLSSTNEMY